MLTQTMCRAQFYNSFAPFQKSLGIRLRGSKYNLKPIQHNEYNFENQSVRRQQLQRCVKWRTRRSRFGLFFLDTFL